MLVCLTANHQNARFEVLEKLAVGRPGTAKSLIEQSENVSGAVVLATCNRFEVYLDVANAESANAESAGAAASSVIAVLSAATGVAVSELHEATETLWDQDVIPHLFSVSSGLKSVVVGEDEIAGQVRRSLEHARKAGTVTPELERLFQSASRTSRGVKTRTAIGHAGRSIVRLALELASSRIVDWAQTRVLLIGTGQYAATTIAALRDRGVLEITVYSPSGRAPRFALKHSVTAATALNAAITDSDVVITCTSREQPVITPAQIMAGHRRLIIDLGLPRNVDAAVNRIEGIELLDLETIRLHAPLEELTANSDAHSIVEDAVAEYDALLAERSTVPAIVELRKHVFDLLEKELARSRSRGSWSAESEAQLRHLVGVLLHRPSDRARELARAGDGQAFVDGLAAVFGIRGEVAPGILAPGILAPGEVAPGVVEVGDCARLS